LALNTHTFTGEVEYGKSMIAIAVIGTSIVCREVYFGL
jgi:hypothetical protein